MEKFDFIQILNLIPLAFVAWVVFKAVKTSRRHDNTDRYFQENKRLTGKKFSNFFGIPNANL